VESTYVGSRTLSPETLNLSITIDLVVLEDRQLGLLALVLDLLWGSVHLLLALLGTSTETEDQMKSRLLLDVVVGEGAAVFELLAGENQALLVRRDPFLVLDLGLDIVDGVGRLHLKGDGLAREGLHEDLHDCLSCGSVNVLQALWTLYSAPQAVGSRWITYLDKIVFLSGPAVRV
jgi:hypothetical protein